MCVCDCWMQDPDAKPRANDPKYIEIAREVLSKEVEVLARTGNVMSPAMQQKLWKKAIRQAYRKDYKVWYNRLYREKKRLERDERAQSAFEATLAEAHVISNTELTSQHAIIESIQPPTEPPRVLSPPAAFSPLQASSPPQVFSPLQASSPPQALSPFSLDGLYDSSR